MNEAKNIELLQLQHEALEASPVLNCKWPVQIGDLVRYVGNGDVSVPKDAHGVVMDFSNECAKFLVDFGNGCREFLHGMCLSILFWVVDPSSVVERSDQLVEELKSVRDIPRVLEFINEEKANLPSYQLFRITMTAVTVSCNQSVDHVLYTTLKPFLEEVLQKTDLREDFHVQIKLNISLMERELGNFERGVEILTPLIDRHFGWLPLVVSLLMEIKFRSETPVKKSWKEYNKSFGIRKLALPCLKFKNYAYQCEASNFWDALCEVAYGTALGGNLRGNMDSRRMKEYEKAFGMLLRTDTTRFKSLMRKSQLYFAKGRPSLALQAINELETLAPQFCNGGGHWQYKMTIYLFLADQKNAKRCLKKLQKFDECYDDKDFEEIIMKCHDPRIARHFADPSHSHARFLESCCNPFCGKVESRPKEFQVCSRCKVVKYCGPQCQKKHWKAGHKAKCKKL